MPTGSVESLLCEGPVWPSSSLAFSYWLVHALDIFRVSTDEHIQSSLLFTLTGAFWAKRWSWFQCSPVYHFSPWWSSTFCVSLVKNSAHPSDGEVFLSASKAVLSTGWAPRRPSPSIRRPPSPHALKCHLCHQPSPVHEWHFWTLLCRDASQSLCPCSRSQSSFRLVVLLTGRVLLSTSLGLGLTAPIPPWSPMVTVFSALCFPYVLECMWQPKNKKPKQTIVIGTHRIPERARRELTWARIIFRLPHMARLVRDAGHSRSLQELLSFPAGRSWPSSVGFILWHLMLLKMVQFKSFHLLQLHENRFLWINLLFSNLRTDFECVYSLGLSSNSFLPGCIWNSNIVWNRSDKSCNFSDFLFFFNSKWKHV